MSTEQEIFQVFQERDEARSRLEKLLALQGGCVGVASLTEAVERVESLVRDLRGAQEPEAVGLPEGATEDERGRVMWDEDGVEFRAFMYEGELVSQRGNKQQLAWEPWRCPEWAARYLLQQPTSKSWAHCCSPGCPRPATFEATYPNAVGVALWDRVIHGCASHIGHLLGYVEGDEEPPYYVITTLDATTSTPPSEPAEEGAQ